MNGLSQSVDLLQKNHGFQDCRLEECLVLKAKLYEILSMLAFDIEQIHNHHA